MGLKLAKIPNEQVALLVKDIDNKGFATLPNYIDAKDLNQMRSFVAAAVRDSNGESFALVGQSAVSGSGLDELSKSEEFRGLMTRIYEHGTGLNAPKQDFYQLLRCLIGHTARKHSYVFHYDAHFLTALIPIEIPANGLSGDLIMIPNIRAVRTKYLFNLIDKGTLYAATRLILPQLAKLRLLKLTRIKMVPGNAYFFWGYRSVHTNEPCDIDKVRATALFHYVDPHKPDLGEPRTTCS